MSDERTQIDEELERLQGLLMALEGLSDPAAKTAARELVQVVINLHAAGLSELLDIVAEADTQPADTLLPKFAANARICGLLLLHDLHPDDLPTRAAKAVDRLRPHLGVQGVRAELTGVDDNVIRISVTATGQKTRRPPGDALKREIEEAVLAMTPDAAGLVIDGLDVAETSTDVYVPLASITGRKQPNEQVGAARRE